MPRAILLLLLACLLAPWSGATAFAQEPSSGEAWGTRPYAEEKALFDALVAELEGKIAAVDARIATTAGERDAYWQDWSDDERTAAREWFGRSTHYPSAGNRLNWANEQRDAASKRLTAVLESGRDVDFAADTPEGMARRAQLWSAQITLLRRELTQRNEQAIYDGIELQAIKSYLGSLINRDLGMSVEEFAADTVDDLWYVVRSHADKFWDDMFACAVKMVGRGILRRGVGLAAPEFVNLPDVPGVVSTPEGVVMECMGDIARDALVNAFTAGLRKNFVDDMVAQGIYPEVAEYWWATFILAGEEPEGPNAPRVKPVLEAIRDRLGKAVERTMDQVDQQALEQVKELWKRELEVGARERLKLEVRIAALEAARAAQSEGARLSGATIRMESFKRATEKLGPDLYAKDASLRFLEGLDAAEVLFRQGYIAYSVLGSEMAFAERGKPLIDEYWEIVRCLGKLERGSGAHLVLQYYGWAEDVRREFFKTCGEAKETENLPEAQMMADRMAGLAAAASSNASLLGLHCQYGNATLGVIEGDATAIEAALGELSNFVDQSTLSLGVVDAAFAEVDDALTKATTMAEETERAKKRTDAAAERACDMTEEVRAATDPDDQRSKLDEVVAAEALAREHAEASRAAARQSGEFAGLAVASAEELAGDLVVLRQIRDSHIEVAAALDDADASLAEAGREAAAAAKASQELARIKREATVLVARARQLLATPAQTDALRSQLATIEELYASVTAAAASDDGCARRLADRLAALEKRLAAARATAAEVAAGIAETLEGIDVDKLGQDVVARAEEAQATGDVADAIAGAAEATAADAGSCLELARAALQGGEAELAAAARAALGQCDFPAAKAAIERLPAGPEREALVVAYRGAFAREQDTLAMWNAADAAFKQGDYEEAYLSLEEAYANTACDSFKARIAEGMARVTARHAEAVATAARDAIARCDFAAAEVAISNLGEAGWAVAELRAALEAATTREEQASALYEEADGHAFGGDDAAALAALRQAQALSQCEPLKSSIAGGIAQLEGGGEEQEQAGDEDTASSDVAAVPVSPTADWAGPWRGTLQLQEIVVNGARTPPRDLAARIEREWQAFVARRAAEGSPLSPMEEDISGQVKELVKSGLMLVDGPLPLSFVLLAEGGGYRLALPGAPAPAEDDPALVQFVRGLPLFMSDGQGGWRAALSDKGSTIDLTIAPADSALSRLDLGLALHFQVPPDVEDAGSSFNIRSLSLTIAGSAVAGETGYADLVADYRRLLSERAGR